MSPIRIKYYISSVAETVFGIAIFLLAIYNTVHEDLSLKVYCDDDVTGIMLPSVHITDTAFEPVNINSATRHELQMLDGIGEIKATAIIAYREQHGAFSSVDDLINVSGIGEKTLEKLRDKLTV